MARPPSAQRVAEMRWVHAIEMFHQMYIPSGPYKTNVPRLVKEIAGALDGGEELYRRLLSEFGRRGATVRHSRLSSPTQLSLFPGGTV